MSETRHTQRPLTIWGQQKKTEIGGFTVIGREDKSGGCTAYVCSPDDAALYVAAPDLLEALKECRNAMHADNPADGWAEIIAAADAAIAKAECRS